MRGERRLAAAELARAARENEPWILGPRERAALRAHLQPLLGARRREAELRELPRDGAQVVDDRKEALGVLEMADLVRQDRVDRLGEQCRAGFVGVARAERGERLELELDRDLGRLVERAPP